MTLKELSEHPERASEEDKKAFEEALKAISKFKEQSKYILNGIVSIQPLFRCSQK